ncbi:MAG: cyclodeaminase/cyclohydrolase family protein [Chloroflexi bacterium]|nr:cyclodeaminase/cyclohydrolase family protein [Chloroflexota bacterium]
MSSADSNPSTTRALLDLTLREFLAATASSAPVPGGGSVASLVGALAAGLIAMSLRVSLAKITDSEQQSELERLIDEADSLRARLEAGVDADAAAFAEYSAALKLPRTDEAAKAGRAAALLRAAHSATEAPLTVADLAADALELSERAVELSGKSIVSDVGVAAALAEAAVESALLNVTINLPALKDSALATSAREKLATQAESPAERRRRVLARTRQRISG